MDWDLTQPADRKHLPGRPLLAAQTGHPKKGHGTTAVQANRVHLVTGIGTG